MDDGLEVPDGYVTDERADEMVNEATEKLRAENDKFRAERDGLRYREMWRLGFSVGVPGAGGMSYYTSKAAADAAIDALLEEEQNEPRG